jgi:hypothetical protein
MTGPEDLIREAIFLTFRVGDQRCLSHRQCWLICLHLECDHPPCPRHCDIELKQATNNFTYRFVIQRVTNIQKLGFNWEILLALFRLQYESTL